MNDSQGRQDMPPEQAPDSDTDSIMDEGIRNDYFQVPTGFLHGNPLSFEAQAMFIRMKYLQECDKDFRFDRNMMRAIFGIGQVRVQKLMTELETHGYLRWEVARSGESGKFKRTIYHLSWGTPGSGMAG